MNIPFFSQFLISTLYWKITRLRHSCDRNLTIVAVYPMNVFLFIAFYTFNSMVYILGIVCSPCILYFLYALYYINCTSIIICKYMYSIRIKCLCMNVFVFYSFYSMLFYLYFSSQHFYSMILYSLYLYPTHFGLWTRNCAI